VAEQDADATVNAALAAGLTYIDTAPHYGLGLAERRLGRVLAERPRDGYIVSTKVGRLLRPLAHGETADPEGFVGVPPGKRVWNFSGDGVRRSLEESLERLGLSRVDIVFVHDPDDHEREACEEAFPALAELRDQGVVRAIGAGMNQAEILQRFVRDLDLDVVLVAGRYSLLDQRALAELLPACAARGVAVVVGGAFNSGLLADPRPGATFDYAPAPPELVERAARLDQVCARHGVSLRAAALAFPVRPPRRDQRAGRRPFRRRGAGRGRHVRPAGSRRPVGRAGRHRPAARARPHPRGPAVSQGRVDVHHHLWDPTRRSYPSMGQALAPIRRPFTAGDLDAAAGPHGFEQTVAVVIPIYVFFQHLGLLDTRTALVLTYAATNLPIVVWLMRDYFNKLPRELEEAAVVDGASTFRVFRSITLPLSVPGLVATFLIVLVFAWNEYLLALFLSSADAQTMPLTVAAQNATRGPQRWYMSVLIQIMILPVIALAIALERVISRGLLVGAVKG
jgi:D-threo-aldose 1-dehydrogenase